MQPAQQTGDVPFRVYPVVSGGDSAPQYAFSKLRHLQDHPLP